MIGNAGSGGSVSHLSYPALSFFRSQHNNQSWLAALTTILDASSLVIAGVDGLRNDQAKITFAMARHAVVIWRRSLTPATIQASRIVCHRPNSNASAANLPIAACKSRTTPSRSKS